MVELEALSLPPGSLVLVPDGDLSGRDAEVAS